MRNPYDWTRTRPQVEIPRPELPRVVDGLRRGKSFILLAGRGMGKSVFLDQVRRDLGQDPDVRVFLVSEPPMNLTAHECLRTLGNALDVDIGSADLAGKSVSDVVEAYLEEDVPEDVVLLFDEFDRYAVLPENEFDGPPGRNFFNSVEVMRRSPPGAGSAGVLAAGSIGAFAFRDVLGSPFVDRASRVMLRPFAGNEIRRMSRPFTDRDDALCDDTLQALQVASGGNPALVTYGLEALWSCQAPSARDVVAAFSRFREENSEFVRGVRLSFANPRFSDAPQRLLALIQRRAGEVLRADLRKACGPPDSLLHLDFADVLALLKAAGLVRLTGSAWADPVVVQPINSILTLPDAPSTAADLQGRLRDDIAQLLSRLQVSSADFFRPGGAGRGKQLVPEAVFAAFLALGLELLGWQADRETQRGAGRTDILLRRAGGSGVAVVETKIWGRNDYRHAQRQVESYWSTDTAAAAVVMLTDAELDGWASGYQEACLAGYEVQSLETGSSVRALKVLSQAPDGLPVVVEHFLLRLLRRR